MENFTKSLDQVEEKQFNQMESQGEAKNFPTGRGGWISSLLILGTSLGTNIASGAWYSNLIVFLITEFNVKSIPAAQINNIFSGFINFFPFIAAIAVDSSLGAFTVVLISSIFSLMGVTMFTLIVTVHSLKPPSCAPNSTICLPPSKFQLTFLYIALALASIGLGGARFILGTMGADQLSKPKHQAIFFNWFIFTLYISSIIGYTLLIYLEGSVSWALVFGIALVSNVIAVILFVSGSRIYRRMPSKGSPFSSIARVFVAAIRKITLKQPLDGEDSYYYGREKSKSSNEPPSKSLRFFNRAALIQRGNEQEQCNESWSLCTVEEVEDLKRLIKLIPLWSTGIFLSTPIGVTMSLTVLLALVMDRSVGSHFKIPAGSFVVVTFIFTAITTSTIDRFIYPMYKKLTGRDITYLQSIGVGHVANILAMIGFALIERKRLSLVRTSNLMNQPPSVAPLSAFWLVLPLAIMGIGEGFSVPQEVAFFYQEFPSKVRSTSTAMVSLHIAAGFYLSSAFINLVGRTTSWLPSDINHGRVDNVCWVLLVVAALNFGYFLLCATLYKYNNPTELSDETVVPDELDGATIVPT